MRATKSMTPENRKLAERSFQALPGLAQCVLWHTEVEAEHISVPAGLLGMDPDTASAALDQAREQFRQGCVRAHRELAPNKDCRYYNRLLDVPIRRGGTLLPDVQQHLLECRFCRYAAEQLSHFEGGQGSLGVLLAESVLGWGARRYLDSRPGRGQSAGRPSRSGGRRQGGGGRHRGRVLPQFSSGGGGRRAAPGPGNSKAMLTGIGVVSGALLATVLITTLWPQDDGGDPSASGTPGPGQSATPGPQAPPAGSTSPPPALPTPPVQTRLRNLAADLCLDIKGGKAQSGASLKLEACSSAETQEWSYEEDGLLRSVANSDLCVDSHVDAGVVVLGNCASAGSKRGDDVRYDLTVQGELLPRWQEDLAVAPAAKDEDSDVVVKIRDRSDEQRWRTDGSTSSASPESLSVAKPVSDSD